MLDFSNRLVEERKRLSMSQKELSTVAGVSKTTQYNYEKGDRVPDAAYLEAIRTAGLDVMYILSGSRSLNSHLSAEETALVDNYRACSESNKGHLQAVGTAFAEQKQPELKNL